MPQIQFVLKILPLLLFFVSLNTFGNTDTLQRFNSNTSLLKFQKANNILKNKIYFQLFGDTPTFGIGYRRTILDSEKWTSELGAGFGFMPQLLNERINPKPSKLIFSHSFVFLKKNEKLIRPTFGYSGIMYSGLFYKNKMYSYIPSPNIGLRIGRREDLSFNITWYGHFHKKDDYNLKNGIELETIRKTLVFIMPAFNIQRSF